LTVEEGIDVAADGKHLDGWLITLKLKFFFSKRFK
jgi:hypothetical protein